MGEFKLGRYDVDEIIMKVNKKGKGSGLGAN